MITASGQCSYCTEKYRLPATDITKAMGSSTKAGWTIATNKGESRIACPDESCQLALEAWSEGNEQMTLDIKDSVKQAIEDLGETMNEGEEMQLRTVDREGEVHTSTIKGKKVGK